MKTLIASLILLLTGCASMGLHPRGGFYSRETNDTYAVFVGGAVEDEEFSFLRGSYELCQRDHKSGFKILQRSSDEYGSVDARIQCIGPIDPYLKEQYKNRPMEFRDEPSSVERFQKEYLLVEP